MGSMYHTVSPWRSLSAAPVSVWLRRCHYTNKLLQRISFEAALLPVRAAPAGASIPVLPSLCTAQRLAVPSPSDPAPTIAAVNFLQPLKTKARMIPDGCHPDCGHRFLHRPLPRPLMPELQPGATALAGTTLRVCPPVDAAWSWTCSASFLLLHGPGRAQHPSHSFTMHAWWYPDTEPVPILRQIFSLPSQLLFQHTMHRNP